MCVYGECLSFCFLFWGWGVLFREGKRERRLYILFLGRRGVVTFVGVRRALVPDRAEQYHAGDEAEELEEADDEADGADEVQSLNEPHLNRGGAAVLVPAQLAILVVVLFAAVA